MSMPDLTRIPEYYHRYVQLVTGDHLPDIFAAQMPEVISFLQNIPPDKSGYRYADGKWSVKELLQHVIDAERIFAYRALCIARNDKTPLPGFDENSYAEHSCADKRDWSELIEEFRAVRRATEMLFNSLDEEQLNETGTASGKPVYVSGIGFIIAGHLNHHINILKERYFK